MEETDELVTPGEEVSREPLSVENEREDIESDNGNLGTVSVEQNALEQNHEVVTEEVCKYFDDGLDETPTNSTFCLEFQADELPIMSQVIIIESVNSSSRIGSQEWNINTPIQIQTLPKKTTVVSSKKKTEKNGKVE